MNSLNKGYGDGGAVHGVLKERAMSSLKTLGRPLRGGVSVMELDLDIQSLILATS